MTGRPMGIVCVAGLAILLAAAAATVAAGSEAAGSDEPVMAVQADGSLLVDDPANGCSLSLPGPYWECRARSQIASEVPSGGGGCAPAAGVPSSVLLVMRNKDARAVASLERLPQRFLMRGKDDLETYTEARRRALTERAGGGVESEPPSFAQRDGMIVYRIAFGSEAQDQRYVLANFFVRPQGEDARIYQLVCMAASDDSGLVEPDFERMAASFRFTGEPADSFFVPDAPEDKLPSAEARRAPAAPCGQGYAGMILAMAVVFVLYWLIRRRQPRPGL